VISRHSSSPHSSLLTSNLSGDSVSLRTSVKEVKPLLTVHSRSKRSDLVQASLATSLWLQVFSQLSEVGVDAEDDLARVAMISTNLIWDHMPCSGER